MYFNEQLIYLRKQRGLSQEQLGAKIGVTRQTVSKWELGETTPEMDKLIQLSDLFGITLDALVGREANDCPSVDPSAHGCLPNGNLQNNAPQNVLLYRRHYEYKSKRSFHGIPLVHINVGDGLYKATGIIAIGTCARGILSIGAASAGLISFGAVSAGVLSIGALSAALLFSAGAISVGTVAAGGLSVGILAIGGCAIGVYSIGGCALAQKIAAGGYAHAPIAIGEKTNGEFMFNIKESIPANAIKTAILHKYPKTWKIIVEIFNSFL